MGKNYGYVLWIDHRTNSFEGQIKCEDGKKYYFNYSVWVHGLKPMRGEAVKFYLDKTNQVVCVTDLCGTLTRR